MAVGARLRARREELGLTLEGLATRTKIPPQILSAIERDAFERVPSGIFARGYLRAYASAVGLDPETVVEQFLAEQPPPPRPEVRHADVSGPSLRRPADAPLPAPARDTSHRALLEYAVIGIAVVAVLGSVYWRPDRAGGDAGADIATERATGTTQTAHASPPADREEATRDTPRAGARAGGTQAGAYQVLDCQTR